MGLPSYQLKNSGLSKKKAEKFLVKHKFKTLHIYTSTCPPITRSSKTFLINLISGGRFCLMQGAV